MKSIDKITRESLKPNFLTKKEVKEMANSPEFMQKLMGGLGQIKSQPMFHVSKSGTTCAVDSEFQGLMQ